MARLRKANSPPEPSIFIPPTTAQRSTRASPRKTLCESPSKRELRYTSSQDTEDSFLVPKAPASETPKKQRALRPVASNSRLLRKLSNESLATPERKDRRGLSLREDGLGLGLGFSYSKSLARTLARRGVGKEKADKKIEVAVQVQQVDESPVDEEEVDQSLWCGDEDEPAILEKGDAGPDKEAEEDEDEDPVVDVRNRRRNLPIRILQPESDNDADKENMEAVIDVQSQRQSLKAQPGDLGSQEEILSPFKVPFQKGHSTISSWAQDVVDLTSSPEPPQSFILPPPTRPSSFETSSRPTSSYSSDMAAVLTYSPTPTKHRSPRKAPPISRPNTPPPPPDSPSKLISPSKKKNRIPDAPSLRPSLDAFWSADVVNTWNEKHSPSKPLLSPRKQKWLKQLQELEDSSDSDASFQSPTTSPRKKKNVPISPVKKVSDESSPTVAEIRAQRKAFSTSKHALAESFLAEVDNTITGGRIASLSQNTGGIKLVWSKTLKTTAGRANWRREQIRMRVGPNPTDIRVEYRHHCSIELAEKVIDDEERLYNVLAHEYCHLTTFMISEVRNNPHGAEFKAWASKVSKTFTHKGVEVTTKHSYQIAYKYVWECIVCGYEFKRHSKSVDPTRHSCGRCKGKLVQTKPVPRSGVGKGGEKREKSEYQIFVKANFSRVKKRLEAEGLDSQMGSVMAAVAREYKEQKEKKVVEVEELLEGLKIKDDDV